MNYMQLPYGSALARCHEWVPTTKTINNRHQQLMKIDKKLRPRGFWEALG
jgi:hypothetical protein